jgi:5'-nucleotidase
VLLAVQKLITDKPVDLVLSGVNRGSNAADDITYSGTVAGAMEATQLGIPALALSQLFYDAEAIHWKTGETFAPDIIRKLIAEGWPKGSFLNLNFPACDVKSVKGVVVAPQGKRNVSVALTLRNDPRGRPYYWLGGDRDDATDRTDVDIARLVDGFVTVTPIRMDMTDYATLERINSLFSV